MQFKVVFILLAFAANLVAGQALSAEDTDLAARARLIAQRSMLIDTHIDAPDRIEENWVDLTRFTEGGNFDYDRARRGGLNLPFMSIYTPAGTKSDHENYLLANRMIDSVEALAGRAPLKFMMVRSTSEAEEAQRKGLIGLAMGMENGSPIEDDLGKLKFFYDRGIRYITLAHSRPNRIADSSFDQHRPWHGLSPFGREVVREMNRLGIMVDVSHISDEAFYQIIEITQAPPIASHSSVRHFTPGFERNMDDDMIRALAAKGGVIQISFGCSFLTHVANQWYVDMRRERSDWGEENGVGDGTAEWQAWTKTYRAEHDFPYASVTDVADHIDYVKGLVGVQYVGIGSDFDGVGGSLPVGLKDVSAYPALIEELLRRGYAVSEIKGILGGNLMRVWKAVEDTSRELRAASPEPTRD